MNSKSDDMAAPDSGAAAFTVSRKEVMVIYGHDHEANKALFDWLGSVGLEPKEWTHLVRAGGEYTGQIVETAFRRVQAVVALFTPDEYVTTSVQLKEGQRTWRLQARPNVLIEIGMALIAHPGRTIVAVLGAPELPSDLAGRDYVRLTHNDPRPLRDLAGRLSDAGCDVDITGMRWLDPNWFPDRSRPLPPPDDRQSETGRENERIARQTAIARSRFLGKLRADLRRESNVRSGYSITEVNGVLAKMHQLASNMDALQVYLATIPAAFRSETGGYTHDSVHKYFETVWNAMAVYVEEIAKI